MAQGLREHKGNPASSSSRREKKKEGTRGGEGMHVKDESNHENLIC